jgi:L,D-transpeptidase catalytic domain
MVAASCVMAVVVAGCGASGWVTSDPVLSHTHRVVHRDPPPPSTTTTTTIVPPGSTPVSTVVATTNGAIPGYPAPGQPSNMTVPGSWYGYPSMLPVIATQPGGWLDVRLAQRPNMSTTWVQQSDVALSSVPYSIVVNLTTYQLSVYDAGSEILNFPAGVGSPDDPTPDGSYFVTMKVPPPGPGYGPFVLVTSDHSDTISDWQASGDAIIAIHGPITSNADALIGTAGAAISHGCVRMHDADLAQLAMIPPGTPVTVFGAVQA